MIMFEQKAYWHRPLRFGAIAAGGSISLVLS
jgi:hypothetical protein